MHRTDFLKLIGAGSTDAEYLPVAGLLRNGNGCVGHYNALLNESLEETCVLVNARIIEFKESRSVGGRGTILDFNDFLEDVVSRISSTDGPEALAVENDDYGKAVPLTAIALDEISVVYPVSHISSLLARASKEQGGSHSAAAGEDDSMQLPTFLDFEKSPVLKVLRTKLW